MKRSEATTVVLLIGAWVMGALMGSQIQRPTATHQSTPGVVRFEPGRYLIETANDSWGTVVTFDGPWWVHPLPMPPSE